MLISRNWLQTYFSDSLPDAQTLSDALTFHAFEIDGIEPKASDFILDVKVTPNRGHDCLSHRGIAKELSAILKLPMKMGVQAAGEVNFSAAGHNGDAAKLTSPAASLVEVSIDTPLCSRYIAAHIQGVKVGPSPQWLRERLEALGQRSINNIVDATNYVMFDLGQPLHAFDASKLQAISKDTFSAAGHNGDAVKVSFEIAIQVRPARAGEKLLALDEKEYELNESMLVIVDSNADKAIGVAGVKGGMPAGIHETTTDIIIESANFDGVSVRKTAQALRLRTDASQRFEQQISPELAQQGMQAVIKLIFEIAGGELVGYTDEYPIKQEQKWVSVTVEKINKVLGMSLTGAEVADVFQRLALPYKEQEGVFEVVVPLERLDLEISEDLIEEVGRIIGYDRVMPLQLPPFGKSIEINKNFYWAEKIREFLVSQGFSEVFTSVFVEKGERVVLNKVDGVKPYLRNSLWMGLQDALMKNTHNKDVLNISQIRLFEIGTIWTIEKEILSLCLAVENVKKQPQVSNFIKELDELLGTENSTGLIISRAGPLSDPKTILEYDLGKLIENLVSPKEYEDLPISTTERYQSFSRYPYIVRDISAWVPEGTFRNSIKRLLQESSGELLCKIFDLDTFEKDGKISMSFRLIFQSFDRTLVESEVSEVMESLYTKLTSEGFEIR